MFFVELYNIINNLIGDDGQTLEDFLEIIEQKFPAKLEDFEKLKNETTIYDVLATYGLDIEGLLFHSDPNIQRQIIGSLDHE